MSDKTVRFTASLPPLLESVELHPDVARELIPVAQPWTVPPEWAQQAAVEHARQSPCCKSKRGAVVVWRGPDRAVLTAVGCNRPPVGIPCDGSAACRASCGQRCLHAEAIAIAQCDELIRRDRHMAGSCELIHVKVDDYGKLVAGKGPCCAPCAALILDVGIGGVWLYQTAASIAEMVLKHSAILPEHVHQAAGRLGPFAGVLSPAAPLWLRYDAADFHRLTMAECKVH